MTDLSQLAPQSVWSFFQKICAIPHPSHHLDNISTFIIEWAQSKNLDVITDQAGNILIKKPATQSHENAPTVTLQSHTDMVPQKNNETVHDFSQDPIQAYIDGDWVTAKGTTLGADNGIGVAASLAILDADNLIHGPIEVLLTADEETGMHGAFGLKASLLKSSVLLNLDSEEEGEICVGCAGGVDATMTLSIERVATHANNKTYALNFTGLAGGHSGVDIHLGRANAIKLLGRFLAEIKDSIQLISVNGGTLRNAIPRESSAFVTLAEQELSVCQQKLNKFIATVNAELDPNYEQLQAQFTAATSELLPVSDMDKERIISTIDAAPNGADKMSQDFEDVVEASLNFGILQTKDNNIELNFLLRSLVDSTKDSIASQLESLAFLSGANIEFNGAYSGWKPDPESNVLTQFINCYKNRYNKEPLVKVIHAGLECGLFKKPYPNMDMISFGPTIMHPHSPSEKVEIKTVAMFYDQLTDILRNIAEG